MSEQRNLRNPKNYDKQAARVADEARARKLLGQAVQEIRRAEGCEAEVSALDAKLSVVRRKEVRHHWEAGRLLSEARRAAPHGTWTDLLDEFKVPPVTDNQCRMLFEAFPDPEALRDNKIKDALKLAKELRDARRKEEKDRLASGGVALGKGTRANQGQTPESPGDDLGGIPVWTEAKDESLPIVHLVRKGQRGWTPTCRNQWEIGPITRGEEQAVNCPKCLGKLTAARAEAELELAAKRPHGSEIGYLWVVEEGDEPGDIDVRWLPITAEKRNVIVTPEKTFKPGQVDDVFRDRREALETKRAEYQHLVEQDQAEIDRLKAEEDRLLQEKRLAEKRLKKVEALLAQEA